MGNCRQYKNRLCGIPAKPLEAGKQTVTFQYTGGYILHPYGNTFAMILRGAFATLYRKRIHVYITSDGKRTKFLLPPLICLWIKGAALVLNKLMEWIYPRVPERVRSKKRL